MLCYLSSQDCKLREAMCYTDFTKVYQSTGAATSILEDNKWLHLWKQVKQYYFAPFIDQTWMHIKNPMNWLYKQFPFLFFSNRDVLKGFLINIYFQVNKL